MAGNRHRQKVGGTRAGDGPHRLRGSDPLRDIRIGYGLSDGYLLKGLPDTLLERRPADVERKVETESGCFDEADDARHKGFVVPVGAD
jgi:hypothetical protein